MSTRRKPTHPRLVVFISLTQFVAAIALLVVSLDYAARVACAQVSAGTTGHDAAGCHAHAGDVATSPQPVATSSAPLANSASIVDDLLAPFKDEALSRRRARAQQEQNYVERVDAALNEGRINFLLFAYGETYEPPYTPDFKGSINIFSLDLRTRSLSTVTINHDIRAPEVEQFRQRTDHKTGPTRIDQSYPVGGFGVMRTTVEDATGLSVDFQLAVSDVVIKRAIDEVFGGIVIPVPFEFDALPVYFDGTRYPEYRFPAGTQRMDGLHAVQYMKAVYDGEYDPAKELTVRKQIVVEAALDALKREALNPLFWTRALNFLRTELDRKSIVFDFDPSSLVLRSLQNLIFRSAQGTVVALPSMGRSVYVVDRRSGDGGVEWITGSTNPIMQRDLEAGVYADRSISVPTGNADPYAADLVADYWTSVRTLIKDKLSPARLTTAAERQ